MLAGESAGSMQAESSKLKAKKGIIPYLYFHIYTSIFQFSCLLSEAIAYSLRRRLNSPAKKA